MTREEAINEINKVFEPAFANYIVEALTKGKTNATNGEVIKALFPNAEVMYEESMGIRDEHYNVTIGEKIIDVSMACDVKWWNTQYKGEIGLKTYTKEEVLKILTEVQSRVSDLWDANADYIEGVHDSEMIIQQKINTLKGE